MTSALTLNADNVPDRWARSLRVAFLAGDLELSRKITANALGAVEPVEVLDLLVAPAMAEVGRLWESSAITVADEHLATATAHLLLAEIAPTLRIAPRGSRDEVAVLTTTSSERHTVGLLMAEAVLEGAGYMVKNLGGGVPSDRLESVWPSSAPRSSGFR